MKKNVMMNVLYPYDSNEVMYLRKEDLETYDKQKLIYIIEQLCESNKQKDQSIKHWQDGFELFMIAK
jgi:hypothetical protein